jgi:MFS family permease
LVEEKLPPHYRRNFIALTGDYVAFLVAMAFADTSTVLPAFARELTSSAPLIGLISTTYNGGWLLPQLIAANYVASQEHKKKYVLWPCILGRPLYLVLAAATFFFAKSHPALVLLALYVGIAGFAMSDGLASVPWFDILSKAIPSRRRGRYLAACQVIGGLLAVGAGVIVQRILDPTVGLPFPNNYSLLFFLAFLFLQFSTISLLLIREPIEPTHAERVAWKEYIPTLLRALRQDRAFRGAVSGRLLAGIAGMATPFYILYGTVALRLGATIIGVSLTVQVIGRILGGVMLGTLIERLGNRAAILCGLSIVSCLPALSLALGFWQRLSPQPDALFYVFPLIFFLLGLAQDTLSWGFNNYVLDLAPPRDRTTYIGLTNTVSGLLVISPVIGGGILQFTSYSVLFVVSLSVYAIALFAAARLPKLARAASPAEDAPA